MVQLTCADPFRHCPVHVVYHCPAQVFPDHAVGNIAGPGDGLVGHTGFLFIAKGFFRIVRNFDRSWGILVFTYVW